MESDLFFAEELKQLQGYDIIEHNTWSNPETAAIKQNVYFLALKGDYLLFLEESDFLNHKEKAALIQKSKKGLVFARSTGESGFKTKTQFCLTRIEKYYIRFRKTSSKLKKMPNLVYLSSPYCFGLKFSQQENKYLPVTNDSFKIDLINVFAPCYSQFKFEAVSDNYLFASTFQTKHNKFNPILLKQRIEYRETFKNGVLVQKKLSNYFQAKYNLTHYKQDRSLHFIGVDQTQTKFVFELINGFKYALKDYFKGDSLYFSVESKLVSNREDYCKLNFKLEEAKRKPKFVLFHVTKAHSDVEGIKIKLFNEDKEIVDVTNTSSFLPLNYRTKRKCKTTQVSGLFSNCSYLFECSKIVKVYNSDEFDTSKPCLLTIIYLFEEDKGMIIPEQVKFILNIGKTLKLGRRPTGMLLEMLIGK